MGKAFADMLPYTLGLIVSPFPVVAVIALLISANGRAKALVFEVTWLVTSWGVLIALIALLGALGVTGHARPVWAAWLALIIGVLLLVMAVTGVRRAARRTAGKAPEVPRWLAAMDTMTPPRIIGVATLLIVANPVNFASLAGGAVGLDHRGAQRGHEPAVGGLGVRPVTKRKICHDPGLPTGDPAPPPPANTLTRP
ncbi:GAP family protein [Nonomuraea rubra]|uniref:GAP family protein n=1 Tax=Nonomuraea rubra TaxID=46180 RepID=UPI003401CFE0